MAIAGWTVLGVVLGIIMCVLIVVYVVTYFIFCLFHMYDNKGLCEYLKWVTGGLK